MYASCATGHAAFRGGSTGLMGVVVGAMRRWLPVYHRGSPAELDGNLRIVLILCALRCLAGTDSRVITWGCMVSKQVWLLYNVKPQRL